MRSFAGFFAKKYADVNALPQREIAPDALAKLKGYSWRGNVRELENTMHRAVLLAQGETIDVDAIVLTDSLGNPEDGASDEAENAAGLVGRTVADVERDLILNTLEHCLGNRTHAANILGISIRTLRNKLKLYSDQGISVPAPGDSERATA